MLGLQREPSRLEIAGVITNIEYEADVRDVEYQHQAGKAWLARIYQPKGTGSFPTIVDVYGGAWHNGDRTNNAGIDRALALHEAEVTSLPLTISLPLLDRLSVGDLYDNFAPMRRAFEHLMALTGSSSHSTSPTSFLTSVSI